MKKSKEITIYGIPNCDSVKKAINWMNENKISFVFHNYKTSGIDKATLEKWCATVGWEKLLNTKGTTWRKIASEYEGKKMNEKLAISIMLEHNSTIKRPVVSIGKHLIIGFDETALSSLLP